MQETQVRPLGWEHPLEKKMEQRVGRDLTTKQEQIEYFSNQALSHSEQCTVFLVGQAVLGSETFPLPYRLLP